MSATMQFADFPVRNRPKRTRRSWRLDRPSVAPAVCCRSSWRRWPRSGRRRTGRLPTSTRPSPADAVRGQVSRWLSQHGLQSSKLVPRIADLWTVGRKPGAGREVLERLIQSFCLAEPDTRRFINTCSTAHPFKTFPHRNSSTGTKRTNSTRFICGCFRVPDAATNVYEALGVFSRIDATRVVDPATCLFYQAVCQRRCNRSELAPTVRAERPDWSAPEWIDFAIRYFASLS